MTNSIDRYEQLRTRRRFALRLTAACAAITVVPVVRAGATPGSGLVLTTLFGATFMAMSGGPATAQAPPSLRLVVQNLAGVDTHVRRRAEKQAGDVLEAAGIRPIWAAVGDPTFGSDAPQWTLVITPELPEPNTRDQQVFGVTPETAAGPGRLAYLLWNHIRDTAVNEERDLGLLLGYAMAHEIGHLLLGSHSHSPTGVMRARWDRNDLTLAERGLLRFTLEEAIRMRRRLDAGPTRLAAR